MTNHENNKSGRYAYEWYMGAQDRMYWEQTKEGDIT